MINITQEFLKYENLPFYSRRYETRIALRDTVLRAFNNSMFESKTQIDRDSTEIKRLKSEIASLQSQLTKLNRDQTPKSAIMPDQPIKKFKGGKTK